MKQVEITIKVTCTEEAFIESNLKDMVDDIESEAARNGMMEYEGVKDAEATAVVIDIE